MVNKITFRSLDELLLQHKYFFVSYETYKERVLSHRLRIARDFFLENEDYHLLSAMQNQKSFFEHKSMYINIFQGKKLFINKSDFYFESEYKLIFKLTGIKLGKEEMECFIRIANNFDGSLPA